MESLADEATNLALVVKWHLNRSIDGIVHRFQILNHLLIPSSSSSTGRVLSTVWHISFSRPLFQTFFGYPLSLQP